MSDDSDFGFGSSSPYSDDDEPSTTTTEALIDDGSEGEQQQRRRQGNEGKNEENEKHKKTKDKKTKDVPSLDGEQRKEDSTTTTEALIDDGSEGEQQQCRRQGNEGKNEENEKHKKTKDKKTKDVPSLDGEQGKEESTTITEALIDDGSEGEQRQQRQEGDVNKNKDNEDVASLDEEQHNDDTTTTTEAVIDDGTAREEDEEDNGVSSSTPNQSSWEDDDNESGDDEKYEPVSSDDDSEALENEEHAENEEQVENEEQAENEGQAENEYELGVRHEEEGCTGGTKRRRRFTLQEKLMYLRVVRRKIEKGISLREASKSINISHKQILDWKKQSEQMKGKSNQHAKSLGDGVQSFLSPYTDRLLSFIFEMRETGMAVSVNSIVLKASQLSREFREKSMVARHSAIRRFINVHGFVHRMGTHLSQRQPSEMEEIARDFVRVTREKLQMSCRNEDYIINMDQTPVPFSYDPKKTIEVVGRRTIHIRKSTCDTKRATCALTVTASGKMITPLFVFKGKN